MFELVIFFDDNKDYFNSFDLVNVYYDNGQKPLGKIINKTIKSFSNFKKITKFDKESNRLFQVADLVTFMEKLFYKIKNKTPLTKAEEYFFTKKELSHIKQIFNNKQLK